MSEPAAVTVSGLWKRYGLPLPGWIRRVREQVRAWQLPSGVRSAHGEDVWALQDVSLEVPRGAAFGIIGHNGAGKSTLLKVLAGVTPVTHGSVVVRGRVFPMVELNAGIHPELTGYENVHLLGAIMGLTPKQIRGRLAAIEDFIELGDWFYRPVRMYSSGMRARLGFGVAMNVEADVLLIDEVLATGDLTFQRKCFDQIESLRRRNASVLLVSHNIRQVERTCNDVILLHQGQVAAQGEKTQVCDRYFRLSFDKIEDYLHKSGRGPLVRRRSGEFDVVSVELVDEQSRPVGTIRCGDPLTVRVRYRAHERLTAPLIGLSIYTTDMLVLTGVNSSSIQQETILEGEGVLECTFDRVPLLPGVFTLGIGVRMPTGNRIYGARHIASFQVLPSDTDRESNYGLVHADARWRILDAPTV